MTGSDANAVRFWDGSQIVTTSYDKSVCIWDAESGMLHHQLTGHVSSVLSASFSPDGKRIINASGDKTARLWDVESGCQRFMLSFDAELTSFFVHGSTLIIGDTHGYLHFVELHKS